MSAAEDLMAKFTGAQKGGGFNIAGDEGPDGPEYPYPSKEAAAAAAGQPGGRRRKSHSGRKGHKSNSWLAHVKATMKLHPGKSFKQVLKNVTEGTNGKSKSFADNLRFRNKAKEDADEVSPAVALLAKEKT